MTRHLFAATCALVLFAAPHAEAVIISGFSTNIAFNVSTGQVSATWSESLERTKDGFIFPTNSLTYGWMQTERIPVGLAWRPPSESDVAVKLQGDFAQHFVNEDRSVYAYIRYGCDGVHWSTWIPMTHGYKALEQQSWLRLGSDSSKTNTAVFTAVLRIPTAQREIYGERMEEWRKTDPDWISDEDAYSRWLLSQDSFFFRDNLPFLGYIQIRLESSFLGARSIRSLEVSDRWVVGGLHHPPKSDKYPRSDDDPWNLLLKKVDKKEPNKAIDSDKK